MTLRRLREVGGPTGIIIGRLLTPVAVAIIGALFALGGVFGCGAKVKAAAEQGSFTTPHHVPRANNGSPDPIDNFMQRTDVTVLTLSDALAMAQRHGPGFAQARLHARSRQLETALKEAGRSPELTVTGRTALQPGPEQQVGVRLDWPFHDDFTLIGSVGRTWRSPTGVSGGGDGDAISVAFSRQLWPRPDEALRRRIDRVESQIANLTESRAVFDAHMEIITAFGALDQTLRAEAIAVTELYLAGAQTRMAADGFATGELGLKQLQDAQHAEREALVGRRRAVTARNEAALALQRLLVVEETGDSLDDKEAELFRALELAAEVVGSGDGTEAIEGIGAIEAFRVAEGQILAWAPPIVLHDDLQWPLLIETVQAELAAAGDSLVERFLASDTTYANTRLGELRAVEARHKIAADSGIQWHADAAYIVPLSGSGSDRISHREAPVAEGQFAAFIGAKWQWNAKDSIRLEEADLALERARLTARSARQGALDSAQAALHTLDDAAFALDVARLAVKQASATLELVQGRINLGLAGPLELVRAQLAAERARSELLKATSAWHHAWLDIARRVGLSVTRLL